MGFGNPPALGSPLDRQSAAAVTSKITCGATISGADPMSLRYGSLLYTHSPRDDIQGTNQSYPHDRDIEKIMMDCFVNPNGLSNHQANSDLINVRSNLSNLRQLIDGNSMDTTDRFMNGGVFSTDYQHPEVRMTSMPERGKVVTDHPMSTQGGEPKASSLSRSQISGTFSKLGASTSMLQHDDNFVQFGSPGKIDGSFLTLGTGANPETRFCRNFSTQEIANKLDEVGSSYYDCHARQTTRNPLIRTEYSGRTTSFQTSAGGLSSTSCNLSGQIFPCNDVGIDRGHNTRPKSLPLHTFTSLQADKHPNHSVNSDGESDFQVDMAPSLMPIGSTFISHPECTRWSALASESAMPAMFPNQLTPHQQQNCYMENFTRDSSKSFMNFHRPRNQGSSIRHAKLGNLVPLSEGHVVENGPFPTRAQPVGKLITLSEGRMTGVVNPSPISVQPVGQLPSCHNVSSVQARGYGMIPMRSGFQPPGSSTFQSAAGAPFPKRLGVQPNDLAAARAAEGDLRQIQNCQLLHYPQISVGHPISMVPPRGPFPAHVNPCGLSVTAGNLGQSHLPTQMSKEFPKADYTKGPVTPVAKVDFQSQTSNVLCRPSFKRRANENSPAAPLVQRRKIVPGSYRQKYIPPPVPAAPLHIKWQGLEEPPKPTGQNCLLCKRDLSFTPEGPIHRLAALPSVAVLPCGHAFHDNCLQKITPQDQSKSPPCIPCAIGET